jgi:hypothetical protein
MNEKRRRRFVFSLGTLFVLVAVVAVAVWIARPRGPKLVPIVVADAAAFVKSDLVLFSPRLPFPAAADTGPPPEPATVRGTTVLSVRGAERAAAVASMLRMAVATPSMQLTGTPEADVVFRRVPISLKADEYEVLRHDAEGHASRLQAQDITTVVIKQTQHAIGDSARQL